MSKLRYRTEVIRYLTDRPGQVVYRQDVATDVGVTADQVQSCVYNVIRNSPIGANIEVVIGGNAWRYVPSSPNATAPPINGAPQPTPPSVTVPVNVGSRRSAPPVTPATSRVFEEIGESQDGTIIIQESETGALYRATLI